MRGISWFRRRRPAPRNAPEVLSLIEASTLHAWGLSLLDWKDLTDQQRAYYRLNIAKAPYFNSPKERAI